METLEYALSNVKPGLRRVIIGDTAEFSRLYNSTSRFVDREALRKIYQPFGLPQQAIRGVLITDVSDSQIVETIGIPSDQCPDLSGWTRAGLLILRLEIFMLKEEAGESAREQWKNYNRGMISRVVAHFAEIGVPILSLATSEIPGATPISVSDLISRFRAPNTEVLIYCDGSCTNNGKPGAFAGWAMYVDSGAFTGLHRFGRVPGLTQTNNRAEGIAVLNSLKFILGEYQQPVTIVTDSKFMINVLTDWLPRWVARDPTLQRVVAQPDGKLGPAKNADMMLELYQILESLKQLGIRVEFEHIRSHKTAPINIASRDYRVWYGNSVVDQLAKKGSLEPPIN